jgi:hypothetical protein
VNPGINGPRDPDVAANPGRRVTAPSVDVSRAQVKPAKGPSTLAGGFLNNSALVVADRGEVRSTPCTKSTL